MCIQACAAALAFLAGLFWEAAQAAPVFTVGAASNVQFALEEVNKTFSATHGAKITVVYNSSGKLASQVRTGAPFDVFVSADMAFLDSLHAWGQVASEIKPYALGLLVMWTTRSNLDPAVGLPLLADATVKRVAIPDPTLAPYGREALAALSKAGILAAVKPKLVYAQNIGQTSQFIVTGAADIGFNAKSVVLAPEMKAKGRWVELDRTTYSPIPQGAAVLRYGMKNNPGVARKYFEFLYSDTARGIFGRYGYLLPDKGS